MNVPYRGAYSTSLGTPEDAPGGDTLFARVASLELGGGATPDLSSIQLKSEKGQANGYVTLDASGKIPSALL